MMRGRHGHVRSRERRLESWEPGSRRPISQLYLYHSRGDQAFQASFELNVASYVCFALNGKRSNPSRMSLGNM